MPPRRSRPLKSLKGRVQRLNTRDDHEKLLRKSNKRLVVIMFYTNALQPAQLNSLRTHVNAVSKKRELSNVLFAELDASQPEFEDLPATSAIPSYPAFQLLRNEQSIQVLTGIQLSALAQQCIENAGKSQSEPTSRWKKLVTAAVLVGTVAVAGYFGYRHQRQNARSPDDQIADLDGKIKDAKDRLAYLTRRKQHKAKREQQKRVTVLEDRRQAVINSQQVIKPSLNQQIFPGDDTSDSDSD